MKLPVTSENWQAVDHFFTAHLLPDDPVLQKILDNSRAAKLAPIHLAPNQAKLLHLLAKFGGARRILEIGTLAAYSTVWLARAIPKDGQIISIDHNSKHLQMARQHLEMAGVLEQVELLEGDALPHLRQLAAQNQLFDLVFIDADKRNNPHYLRAAHVLTRVGGLIVCDNVVRHGRLADLSQQDADIVGIRQYFELLAQTPELDSTAFQTLGGKAWDGFAISLVLAPPKSREF